MMKYIITVLIILASMNISALEINTKEELLQCIALEYDVYNLKNRILEDDHDLSFKNDQLDYLTKELTQLDWNYNTAVSELRLCQAQYADAQYCATQANTVDHYGLEYNNALGKLREREAQYNSELIHHNNLIGTLNKMNQEYEEQCSSNTYYRNDVIEVCTDNDSVTCDNISW